MKSIRKLKILLPLIAALVLLCATPAFAITEAEVEAQVSAAGKESVTGNVLIWFLCAVGFLKVSQKIDSFMASLGVNVGHTGGSMLAEAMIATRGIASVAGAAGHAIGAVGSRRSTVGTSGAASGTGFFKGGLVGMGARKATSDAVKNAVSDSAAVHSKHSAQSDSQTHSGTTSHQASSTSAKTDRTHSVSRTAAPHMPTLGGALFARSLAAGGGFANDVIGKVAQGDMKATGSITGDRASQALMSYMGHTALGENAADVPDYSDVEIGGGRITGVETMPGQSEGIAFGMYHADQYSQPQGNFSTVYSADGAKWYKQYAQDTVSRQPYTAPDNTVAYHESIVKRLPDPPKRKDRL